MEYPPAFMELIQLHERMWGTEQYPGRPMLADLLEAQIVVMWVDAHPASANSRPRHAVSESLPRDGYFMLQAFRSPAELNEALLGALLVGRPTSKLCRKVSKIFVNQKPVRVTGVRLLTEQGSE